MLTVPAWIRARTSRLTIAFVLVVAVGTVPGVWFALAAQRAGPPGTGAAQTPIGAGGPGLSGSPLPSPNTAATQSRSPPQLPGQGSVGAVDAPVLVLTDPGNAYGDAFCRAILPTEGLPVCRSLPATGLTASFPLDQHRALILADGVTLTDMQVAQVSDWVHQGGTLIAMRPADNLDRLLGLKPATRTFSEGYFAIDTSRSPGAGLEAQTLQYHGLADAHRLDGARAVAGLYSSATEDTQYPAVTLNQVGAGTASAYAFDVAGSVLRTRNGDPGLIGRRTVSSDAQIRLADRFGGNYLDLSKAGVPQGDELMHLLTHQLLAANPLPRLWYLPSYQPQTNPGGLLRAAVVLTGDDHGSDSQTLKRFAAEQAAGPPGCQVEDWTCIRSTSYAFPKAFPDDLAKPYTDRGFEVSLHIANGTGGCPRATSPAGLEITARTALNQWRSTFPQISAVHPPSTERWHCYGDWSSDAGVPLADAAIGIRADLSSACWPPTVFTMSQCLLTGTALPMPYADRNGRLTDVVQFGTLVTDENPASSSVAALAGLIANATGPRQFYGYVGVLAHLDNKPVSNELEKNALAVAKAHDIPVISARQAAQFWAERAATGLDRVRLESQSLRFTVTNPAHNLELMVPTDFGRHRLDAITADGVPVPYWTELLDGINYALVPAATAGEYVASYGK